MNTQSAFSSPMGPLHFSHPSQMSSFVVSPSRIRSFFRTSSSSSSSSFSSKSKPSKDKEEALEIEYDYRRVKGSSFTPLEGEKHKTPSSPPPSYFQAIEEDLYCEDKVVDGELEKKKKALIEADKRMSESLKSIGF
ncbi:hypothetical protein JCM5350_006819 [Sporobolomyces pararoseus]